MKLRLPAVALAALLGSFGTARAAITLTIDTASETFRFSGSDTGTLSTGLFGGYTAWAVGGTALPNGSFDVAPAFSANVGFGMLPQFGVFSNGLELDLVTLGSAAGATATFTANGSVAFDYSGLPAAPKTTFESLIGTSVSNADAAGGFSALRVVAIPEPSTYALCAGFGALAAAGLRRFVRRRRETAS